MKPVVIVNFKTYEQATGDRALRLARLCEAAGKSYRVDIRIAVQATDIKSISENVSIPVYAEAIDPVEPGKHSGSLTAQAIKSAGARGAILNHSERYMSNESIVAAEGLLRKEGLRVCVCSDSVERLVQLSSLVSPDFFCVEPPELIGGDVSVSTARPDLVKKAVQVSTKPLLIGAGVRHHQDYKMALELGAVGVLVSSGIVLADHPEKALRNLLKEHAQ